MGISITCGAVRNACCSLILELIYIINSLTNNSTLRYLHIFTFDNDHEVKRCRDIIRKGVAVCSHLLEITKKTDRDKERFQLQFQNIRSFNRSAKFHLCAKGMLALLIRVPVGPSVNDLTTTQHSFMCSFLRPRSIVLRWSHQEYDCLTVRTQHLIVFKKRDV